MRKPSSRGTVGSCYFATTTIAYVQCIYLLKYSRGFKAVLITSASAKSQQGSGKHLLGNIGIGKKSARVWKTSSQKHRQKNGQKSANCGKH